MDSNVRAVNYARRQRMRPWLGGWVLWWLIAVFSLWLRTGFPTHAISIAIYDDELFVRAARYLGAGEWLGPYDNLTLAERDVLSAIHTDIVSFGHSAQYSGAGGVSRRVRACCLSCASGDE